MDSPVLSVSQFIEALNIVFADKVFPRGVTVEGEVAQYKVSQGKWIWFDLKDETGLVSCFATAWQLRTPLEDGMKVRVHGTPKIYPKNGRFSLTVDRVELVGEGALRRAFELLKKRLSDEGLFAPERKRPIPRFPERIGLIASTESDAYADFLRILGNRWGGAKIHVAHVNVQGRDAIPTIVGAFRYFNAHPELAEALVLTRGGGSLEDLQAFNSEEVARAVFGSKIPVIVGVGHEKDETLADYAADLRASTPSNAAERLAPNRADVLREVDGLRYRLETAMDGAIAGRDRALGDLEARLNEHVRSARAEFDAVLGDFQGALYGFERRLQAARSALERGIVSIDGRFGRRLAELSGALERDGRLLASYDPRAVLKRGYAIVRGPDGRVVREAASVDRGTALTVQLHEGTLETEVTGIR